MSSSLSGGVSNTPLKSVDNSFIQLSTKEIRSLFDWFSATFENWNIKKVGRNDYVIESNDLEKVNLFLTSNGFKSLDCYKLIDKKINGFQNVYQLDENIYFMFGSETIKSNNERYLCQLLMSGTGCREFEKYYGGDWFKLFNSILKMNYYNFTRIDLATDDFIGIYNIYDIERKIRKNEIITPFRKKTFYISLDGEFSSGYTIEMGTRGKNQFVIYDKNLEKKAKGHVDEDTSIWYRYEMRFCQDKAKELVSNYLLSFKESFNFNKWTSQIMYSLLDIKISNSKNKQKSTWETDPEWLKFLNCVSKTKLIVNRKIPSTIEKKLDWYSADMGTTNAEFFLTDSNFNQYLILENIKSGLTNMKPKSIFRIKNYLSKKNNRNYTDDEVKEIIKQALINLDTINSLKIIAEYEDSNGELKNKELNEIIKGGIK